MSEMFYPYRQKKLEFQFFFAKKTTKTCRSRTKTLCVKEKVLCVNSLKISGSLRPQLKDKRLRYGKCFVQLGEIFSNSKLKAVAKGSPKNIRPEIKVGV